jgi:type I restriction enzyme R subunit
MIGRGTRLCKDLFGEGIDKTHFKIFDFYGNFDFFRENENGIEARAEKTLTEKIYCIKVDLVRSLQHMDYQTQKYIELRNTLINQSIKDVNNLDESNFKVKQKLVYVHKYKDIKAWTRLNLEDIRIIKENIAPLIIPYDDEELAKRFDHLMYSIENAHITDKHFDGLRMKVINTAEELSKLGTIPQVLAKKDTINLIKTSEFWNNADTFAYEMVRSELRGLLTFIERNKRGIFFTNFEDEIIETSFQEDFEAPYHINNLKNYRMKVNSYLKEHKDEIVIYKLRNYKRLTEDDFKTLEKILWQDLGSKEDYNKEFGNKPMTKMVREIVGLESRVVEGVFSDFINDKSLNVNQLRFVKLIVEYVAKNGFIEKAILQEEPFSAVGSIVDLFDQNLEIAKSLLSRIDELNESEGA